MTFHKKLVLMVMVATMSLWSVPTYSFGFMFFAPRLLISLTVRTFSFARSFFMPAQTVRVAAAARVRASTSRMGQQVANYGSTVLQKTNEAYDNAKKRGKAVRATVTTALITARSPIKVQSVAAEGAVHSTHQPNILERMSVNRVMGEDFMPLI